MRCSRLPMLFDCPASGRETNEAYSPSSDQANLGDAVHEFMKMTLENDPPIPPDELTDMIALKYGVERGELAPLTSAGIKMWGELLKHFSPEVLVTEYRLQSFPLEGSTDVMSANGKRTVIGDWKSGFVQRNYERQLQGYAWLAWKAFGMPESGYIETFVAWLRTREIEVVRHDEKQLKEFEKDLLQIIGSDDSAKTFAPGECCTYCPHQLTCNARQNWIRAASTELAALGDSVGLMSPEGLASLYPRVQVLEKAIARYRDVMRETLKVGPVKMGDGRTLRLEEQQQESIKAREAWPILTKYLSTEAMAGIVKIGKGDMEDAIGAMAPKGGKGKLQSQVMEELRKADATARKIIQKVQVTK